MRADASTNVRVGVVVMLAVALLAAAIWMVGQSSNLFTSKVEYWTAFRNVGGLEEGSDVRIAGYRIGQISDIRLSEDASEAMVVVEMQVERRASERIRKDTEARVTRLGLLGDKYIDLKQGSPREPQLDPGSKIRAVQPVDIDSLLESGEDITTNVLVATRALARAAESIEKGEGLIGLLVRDSERTKELGEEIMGVVGSLAKLGRRVEQGEGTLGMLMGIGPRGKKLAEDMSRMLSNLSEVSRKVNEGEGLLGRMMSDDESGAEVVENVARASAEFASLAERINSSEGLMGRLVRDDEYADKVLGDLSRTAEAIADISERINQGDGTLGKLVADETLYKGLNDILAGAHKGRLTRWVLQSSQKSGAEDRLEAQQQEALETSDP